MYLSNSWDSLPNAIHIDRILESFTSHPDEWKAARDPAWEDPEDSNWSAAWDIMVAHDITNAYYALSRYENAIGAGRSILIALVAYDDSGHLLDSTPEEINILHALGHPYANLFIQAVTVLNKSAV